MKHHIMGHEIWPPGQSPRAKRCNQCMKKSIPNEWSLTSGKQEMEESWTDKHPLFLPLWTTVRGGFFLQPFWISPLSQTVLPAELPDMPLSGSL